MTHELTKVESALLAWSYYRRDVNVREINAERPDDAPSTLREWAAANLSDALMSSDETLETAVAGLAASGLLAVRDGVARLTSAGRSAAYAELEGHALGASEDWLRHISTLLPAGAVLDIGGGSGALLGAVLGVSQRGVVVDLDRAAMSAGHRAGSRPLAFVAADAHHLPLADGAMSAVISRITFMYLDERRAFAEVARVLAPRGRALMLNSDSSYLALSLRSPAGVRALASTAYMAANTGIFAMTGHAVNLAGHRDHAQPRSRVRDIAAGAGLKLLESGTPEIAFRSRGSYYMLFEKA
jgi:ubiquinone/menaquinone biosynthesis C-methylase UbiE